MPVSQHPVATAKQQARQLLEQLPDDATWDDVVYKFAVRRSIERGVADADAGRVLTVEELRRELGLD